MWPDHRLLKLIQTEFPIVQAPMAGVMDADLVIAAAQGGALGSLPCALSVEKAREQVNIIRQRVSAPVNMNFSCHKMVDVDPKREAEWKKRLTPYYEELGLDPAAPVNAANRAPFDAEMCELVEELKPEVVSFYYGLPDQALLKRVKAAGCIVKVPVIATGGIADGRGIAAAFALGAAGVQIGTAYLRCPESNLLPAARLALAQARDDSTVITNVMTGRPARGVPNRMMREVGPISADAPAFPHAAIGLAPLKAAAEKLGKVDFTNLWAGQAVRLGREMPAAELTRALAGAALARLSRMAG
jgi:nitronate monooxygenase